MLIVMLLPEIDDVLRLQRLDPLRKGHDAAGPALNHLPGLPVIDLPRLRAASGHTAHSDQYRSETQRGQQPSGDTHNESRRTSQHGISVAYSFSANNKGSAL